MKPHTKKLFAQIKNAVLITAILIAVPLCIGTKDPFVTYGAAIITVALTGVLLYTNGFGETKAPLVKGGASLILSPDNLTISVEAATADGSAVTVEGCTETTLASGTETTLHAQGTAVILKGKITELYCRDNQLTALNIQGLSALQGLECDRNQLTAQALTSLLTGLPVRLPSDDAKCTLYAEDSKKGNHTDFTAPAELYTALQDAKTKNWKLCYWDSDGNDVEL